MNMVYHLEVYAIPIHYHDARRCLSSLSSLLLWVISLYIYKVLSKFNHCHYVLS
jgi:hypothetical protein